MTPVTDNSILERLNGPSPVTDPAILAKLNGGNGFVSDVRSDWDKRLQNIPPIMKALPDQGAGLTGVQLVGQGAGAIGDVIGEGVKRITPDSLISASHDAASAIDETSIGQKIGDSLLSGKNAYDETSKDHPVVSRTADSLANIMSLGIGRNGIAAVEGAGSKLGLGDAIYNSGKTSQDLAHHEFVQDLILPKQVPTVKADMAGRTKQIDGTNIYQPTPQEQQISASVSSIPGISHRNSLVKNLNLIQDANLAEAQSLKSKLVKNDAPIPDDVIQNTLAELQIKLADNPYISGVDASKAAGNVINKALDIITSKPQTASSMLDARKELDAWVSSQKGDKAFNPALDSPITTAVQQVRQAMNGMVADAVPSADVKASLQKQSNLYQAADNIAPKAADEAPTRLGRALQYITPHSAMGKLAGAAGIGAAADILPHIPLSVAAPTIAGYGLYKGITSPVTRIELGKMLGVSADALK